MTDSLRVTEAELRAKAVAPRVTEEELDANITQRTFFYEGLLTLCVLTLKNGFMTVGESACASPENYDRDIGERLAFEHARDKIWPLMGYALRDRLQAQAELLASRAFTENRDQAVYIGTKVVHAFPLNRRDYNTLRGWELPVNENGDDEGYVVEYTDRIESPRHVTGFKGYVSWSPKDVFERAYRAT